HRVRPEVGNASVYGCLVLLWSSCLAIGGREFGNIRTNKHYGKSPVRGENRLALWIGAIHIGFLAVLLKGNGNQGPHPHKLRGRLSDRLPSGQKNSEYQR